MTSPANFKGWMHMLAQAPWGAELVCISKWSIITTEDSLTPISKGHANLRCLRTESLQFALISPFHEIFNSSGGTGEFWTSEFSVQQLRYLICRVLSTDTKEISVIRKVRIDFYIYLFGIGEKGWNDLCLYQLKKLPETRVIVTFLHDGKKGLDQRKVWLLSSFMIFPKRKHSGGQKKGEHVQCSEQLGRTVWNEFGLGPWVSSLGAFGSYKRKPFFS